MTGKYRKLTWEELRELEKEFIEFLAVNGITGDHWRQIKEESLSKTERFIELFSDVIFEASMRKIRYLEMRSKHELLCFQCLENELVLVGMKDPEKRKEIDFRNPEFIQRANQNPPKGLEVFTQSKKYSRQRELELFDLTQKGALITDDKLFKSLCMAL